MSAAELDTKTRGGPVPGRARRIVGPFLTVASVLLVWVVAAAPADLRGWGPGAFLLPPPEFGVLFLVALLPGRWRRAAAVWFGIVLALVALLKALHIGFRAFLGRPFDVVDDWGYLATGVDVLTGLRGPVVAWVTVVAALVVALGLLILVPAACLRICEAVAGARRRAAALLVVLALMWAGVAAGGGWPAGFRSARDAAVGDLRLVTATVAAVPGDLADRRAFAADIAADPHAGIPPERLLAHLEGKDVLVVFVESLGRVALEDPEVAPIVKGALADASVELGAAGFEARSAWLESPTFGGVSWLAHSTLESGLWVDSERRYNQLLASDRLTLTRAFGEAGWRTVFDLPAMDRPWPQGRPFYGFDDILTSLNVGYRGARYGYAPVPDQYTLDHFAARELGPGPRPAVMAEIDLVSSHYPWTPPPPLLEWGSLGDGAAFTGPAPSGTGQKEVYAEAVAYSLRSLAGFVAHSGDQNLVVLALGDHQPNGSVTTDDSDRQVPVMLIARDPQVFARTADWDWDPGTVPGPAAPVWSMGDVRDRLFLAFRGDH